MIKLKLSVVENKDGVEFPNVPGELLSSLAERCVRPYVTAELKIEDSFVVLVNGMKIEKDMWAYVQVRESDNILIAPMLKGGDDPGALLRTALIIVSTLVLPGLIAPSLVAAGGVGAGLLSAGVSIAATLLFSALIPPPQPKLSTDAGAGSSQMYSFSGQSNAVKRYETVPKVYGVHRLFPPIAANPYTELEADPATGNLVQYYYAIYDFGLGPLDVREIKIGDTPIRDFNGVQYRLVDFNKPAISEGTWDDNTVNTLSFYKGDVSTDNVNIAINSNEGPSVPVGDYQILRTAPDNTSGTKQEIGITLVNPGGLTSFAANGTRGTVKINLTIEFSKVGEDIWRGYNDPIYTENVVSVGGSSTYAASSINLYPPGVDDGGIYPETQPTVESQYQQIISSDQADWYDTYHYYGLLKGATTVVLAETAGLVGKYLKIRDVDCGRILSEAAHSSGYKTYTFENPLPTNITLFTFYKQGSQDGFLTPVEASKSDTSVANKAIASNLVVGAAQIERNETGNVYSTFKFTPKDIASYKIRITRKSTVPTYTSTVQSGLTWAGLTSRFDRDPIVTDKRHVFLEVKILATNQLNGSIQNLSAICSSVLDVWTGSAWEKQISSNPAWVFVDLLTGEINKRAISKDRLHLPSIVEWADFCDEVPTPPPSQVFTYGRFLCNTLVDYTTTLQSILSNVTNSAQASLNIIDGKYGVLIDNLKTVPVQIFTPRNSSNFGSTRSYSTKPDAIKVTYIDPSADWESRETIVYDNGFDVDTATTFDELTAFGCTNPQQAWRYGRYMLAQNRLRQEKISITVDFENLVCTRGDYVQFTQDVMKVGGTPARVKKVTGNQIVIDDAIETLPESYGYIFRASDGTISQGTLTVDSSDTFTLDDDIPAVGDLIVIGVVGSIAIDCIVKSIEPIDDMRANLLLVEKADAIYTAESTDVLPDYSPQISPTTDTDFAPPGEVQNLVIADSYYDCNGNALDYKVDLDWDVPAGAAYEIFEIWVDSGKGYNLVDSTKESFYTYLADPENLGITHNFKVIAVSATGKKLDIGAVTGVSQLISRKTDPPSDVEFFNADITDQTLQLFWTKIPDCSCQEYLIRYSPTDNGSWERSIPMLRVGRDTNLAMTQARTGTYLIKAVDFEGNESATAAAIITTIPELFALNVIDETTDFPSLVGTKERVVKETGALILDTAIVGGVDTNEYYSDGYYYYENLLDVGDIYTVRLQSLIQAEGYTIEDLMSNWTTLADLDAMAHAGSSDWDVETQYRTTDSFNVIADWMALSDIDPISEGDQDIWTAWKKFTIGDATGRIFAFRLRLISNKVSVTPRVFDGTIKADMPDRFESYPNQTVDDSSGLTVAYSPAFKGPSPSPSVQVTIEDASTGDYIAYDYKTLDGFLVRAFDKDGNPVTRQVDIAVKGYGRKATAVI